MQNIVNQGCVAGGGQSVSVKMLVLGIERSRVSIPTNFTC